MSADDCVKVIAAIAAAQAATVAAVAKVYLAVRENSQRLQAVTAVVGADAKIGESRT